MNALEEFGKRNDRESQLFTIRKEHGGIAVPVSFRPDEYARIDNQSHL